MSIVLPSYGRTIFLFLRTLRGFLPVMEYPIAAISEYLRAHGDGQIRPVIASDHPALSDLRGVVLWLYRSCSAKFDWEMSSRMAISRIVPSASGEVPLCGTVAGRAIAG